MCDCEDCPETCGCSCHRVPAPAEPVDGETKPMCWHENIDDVTGICADCMARAAIKLSAAPVVAAPAEGKHCANCSKLNPEYTFPCGDSYCWHCQDNRGRHDDCEKCAEAAKSWFALRASTPPPADPAVQELLSALHKLVAFQCEVVRSNCGQISEYEELPEPIALLRKFGIKDPTRMEP